ncbi:Uncharacterised protein [Zhongshania aliphaticivorans]|uniref:Uncharacterized protein n=1 Tax=Zhongshania aliphaticivorans TaxID=1470434 RepID=A0A5S9N6X3_9GAMM|nr:hypothetical protein [Zhongshania aliphaticivorans]CAA0081381.1 Uncharacterised protein [Zhongshania aliphaticivorans]CAA0085063.1 Uncharacterised protein [Zhongshania aliphaticivorans]
MTDKQKWYERLKNRRVVGGLVILGISLGGGSIALAPAAVELVCALVGCA